MPEGYPTTTDFDTRLVKVETTIPQIDKKLTDLEMQFRSGFAHLESLISQKAGDQSTGKRFAMQLFGFGGVPLVSALWFVITLQITSITAPINRDVSFLSGQQQSMATNIQQFFTQSAAAQSEFAAYKAEHGQKLSEIETQFRAADEVRNVQFAEQSRMNAMVGEAAGVKLPQGPYYFPHIAKEKGETR